MGGDRFPRRRVVFIAVAAGCGVAAALLPSCGSSPPAPSQPTIYRITISGPATIAPGSTAQLTATVLYTNGSTTNQTDLVQWHSSDTSILTVAAGGVASGIQSGDVTVTATLNPAIAGTQAIEVVPTGTFRLSGTVSGFGSTVSGATIQVNGGIGAGLSVLTNFAGAYRVYGVAGNVQVTVSKDAYVPVIQNVNVTGNTTVNFDMAPINPPPVLAGTYTLRFIADPSCATDGAGALPSIARDRRYTATIDQSQNRLHVVLSGATLVPGADTMYGTLAGDGSATFYLDDYFYYKTFDVAEVLPDGSGHVWAPTGGIIASRSGNNLAGTLDGDLKLKASANGSLLASCTSTHHTVTFTKTGSSTPARSH